MEPWRKNGIAIALLAMAAWSVYCAFFFLALATPPIEGAAEATALWRLAIVGGWLSGMVVGASAILGLARNTFSGVRGPSRTRLAAVALVTAGAAVIALYWLELSGLLIFFWAPLTAGVLLLVAWASGPVMRRRLAVAAGAWLIGFAAVAALRFALPHGTLQFHFWTILGVLTVAVVAWCIWPSLRSAARRLEAS
jgi:hypothetical protein